MIVAARRSLRTGVDALARAISRNYIAGPTLEDAARVGRVLASRGYAITFGYWDSCNDNPSNVAKNCLAACGELAALGGENYLSVKAPALGESGVGLRDLAEQSSLRAVPLHFDSLSVRHAAPTFDAIKRCQALSDGEVGCTLPGRWRRSLGDAALAIEHGLVVRVVKGQSLDPDEPERDAADGFLDVIRILAGRARRVRVASHNYALARRSLEILRAAETPYELELLYGLPVGRQVELAREFAAPVRVYVAFGNAYLPYAIGSLRKNPGAILSLLKEATRGDCLATFPELNREAGPGAARNN